MANEAVIKGDYEGFLDFCAENTKWSFVGDRMLEGKEQVKQYMKDTYLEPPKFDVKRIIEDGDFVTVIGEISLKNANGSYDHFDYCDNWRFESGKMAELKAFVVEKKTASVVNTP